MMNSSSFKWISAGLLCTTLVMGMTSLYLYTQIETLQAENQRTLNELDKFTMEVNIKIDYGNGSMRWYNNTRVNVGDRLLNATGDVVNVSSSQSSLGAFINSINNVGGDPNHWWIWWYYDNGWKQGPVGADQWILHEGDIVSWIYTGF
jgi:hypothetical protein